jgi:aminopeptidase N
MKSWHIRLLAIFSFFAFAGCGLFGIHFQVQNPKKATAFPKSDPAKKIIGTLNEARTCYDAQYYDISVDLQEATQTIAGAVDMRCSATADFSEFQLDLEAHLQIDSLLLLPARTPLTYTRKMGAVLVKMPKKMQKGDKFIVRTVYHGKPVAAKKPPWDGGFVWKKDKQKRPWIGVACEGEGGSLWLPLKDHNSDEPDSIKMHLTTRADLVAVGNGKSLGESPAPNGRKTFHYAVSYPINVYNITCYAGKFVEIKDSFRSVSGNDVAISHFVLQENKERATEHFAQAKRHIAVYEKYFGKYQFQKDCFRMVESPYAGMEHQSAIAYGNGFKNDNPLGFDYIILHETGHEWFGNSITAADLGDGWLQEGFTTYAECLFVENEFGHQEYLKYLLQYRLFVLNKRPMLHPYGERHFTFDSKDQDIYMKGAWVLHTLRYTLQDDDLFFKIIKKYATENAPKVVTSQDFINTVNEVSGKDYTWFFDQYLRSNEVPVFEYRQSGAGFEYRWANTKPDFKMPVKLKITKNGVEKETTVVPTREYQTLSAEEFSPFFGGMYALMVVKKGK